MKTIIFQIAFLVVGMAYAQEATTIKVIVPDKTDEVYIHGNQRSLGNWSDTGVKMEKVSDLERAINVELEYPAEFKFTRGGWDKEGIVGTLSDNPNQKITGTDAKTLFVVKGWADKMQSDQIVKNYALLPVHSEILNDTRQLRVFLPREYSAEKRYPVIYITDAGTSNFEVAVNAVSDLSRYRAIPECIVVGIAHKDRQAELDVFWSEKGKTFKDYLFREVVPMINETYATSGYNVMIGHSDGAEFNHHLMLQENNPFRGFISLSTALNKDVSEEITAFAKGYRGKELYYYIANPEYDIIVRTNAGHKVDSLLSTPQNKLLRVKKEEFKADHQNIVGVALDDGLMHVFSDYGNLKKYDTFKAFAENYLPDTERIYGITPTYKMSDIDYYYTPMFMNKDVEGFKQVLAFSEKHKIYQMNASNLGNAHYWFDLYPESIYYWNKALDEIEDNEPKMIYYNFHRVLEAYEKEDNPEGALEFLEKAKMVLPQYELVFNYYYAKVALENKLEVRKGQIALEYCIENFKKNSHFKEEDLSKLKSI